MLQSENTCYLPCKKSQTSDCQAQHCNNFKDHIDGMAYCKSVRGDKKKGDISDQKKTNGSDNKIDEETACQTAP